MEANVMKHNRNENTITSSDAFFIYSPPPDTGAKVILLTAGMVCIIGPWRDGSGVIAWHPLIKRDKEQEEKLGLLK
jgi:hypothetical protein